jgi:hypothetical protein
MQCVDHDGEIVEFNWDYGDGCRGESIMNQHVFNEIDCYFARLTIKDDGGLAATGEIMIIVTGAPE